MFNDLEKIYRQVYANLKQICGEAYWYLPTPIQGIIKVNAFYPYYINWVCVSPTGAIWVADNLPDYGGEWHELTLEDCRKSHDAQHILNELSRIATRHTTETEFTRLINIMTDAGK